MSGFWRTWLLVWCWLVGIFGLLLIGYGFEPTEAPIELFLRLVYPAEFEPTEPIRFALGISGALTLLIGAAYHIAIKTGIQNNLGAAYWRSLLIPLLLWFVTDSAVSVATGFKLNLIPNTAFLIGIIVPFAASGIMKNRDESSQG